MHIVMIANETNFVFNLRKEVLAGFVKNGHRVSVVCQILSFREQLEEMGCQLVDVKTDRQGTNPLSDIGLFWSYLKALRKLKPDVVFTNNIKPNVYGGLACRLLGIKTIPNITGLGNPVENPGRFQKFFIWLYKIGVSNATCVLFQNQENVDFFRSRNMLNKKSRICLLPGSGVSLETHKAMAYPSEGVTHFLFIARILKEKGIDLYLTAAEHFRAQRQDVVFHICGGCDDERYLSILEDAQNRGIVEYHGQQKDMLPFYAQAGWIVHPSYYPEGMSNVLLEAAAHARPIIATDRSGCRETVDDGVTGYVIPIKDSAALIAALEQFLSLSHQQRIDMGLAGREKMEREFDRQIVVEKYLEELSRI